MASKTIFMDARAYAYYLSVSLREHIVLASLRERMKNHPMGDFQISPEQGQYMGFLTRLIECERYLEIGTFTGYSAFSCERYLEIGTFTGYSAFSVAQVMPSSGTVVTCDKNSEWTDVAQRYWKKGGVADKIELRMGDAQDTLKALLYEKREGYFDMAFIDADKLNHDKYYEYCLQLVRSKGIILLDNVFRHRKVFSKNRDEVTQAVHALNEKIHKDNRVDMCLLPISDGLTVIQKR